MFPGRGGWEGVGFVFLRGGGRVLGLKSADEGHYRCIFCTHRAQPLAVTAPVHSCPPWAQGLVGGVCVGLSPVPPHTSPPWRCPCRVPCSASAAGPGASPPIPFRPSPSMFVVINPWSSHASPSGGGGASVRVARGAVAGCRGAESCR